MRHIWTYATADAACREDALSFEDLSLSLSQTMNIHGPIWAALRPNASQSLLPPLVILCMCHSIICFWCLSLSVSLSSVCVCVCVCGLLRKDCEITLLLSSFCLSSGFSCTSHDRNKHMRHFLVNPAVSYTFVLYKMQVYEISQMMLIKTEQII